MADWPLWVWVLIAVIALIIIVAIIFGTRRTDDVDAGGPFAREQPTNVDPLTPRRGVATDPVTEPEAFEEEPVAPGRRADKSLVDEDEETLTGPLAVPAEAGAGVSQDTPSATQAPSDDLRAAPQPTEDFAAEAATETTDGSGGATRTPEQEWTGDTAGDPPPQRLEDSYVPEEPVLAAPDDKATEEPEAYYETPRGDDGTEVEPESVADEGRAVEAVPETAPAPATESPEERPLPPADIGSPDDNDPPEKDFVPPKHADGADYGDPIGDVDADDDVPRDDLGRRLDPYGNPVD